MTDTLPFIRKFLESTKLDFEIMDCEPDLADTNIFCKKYGIKLEDSANTIVVKSKTGELKYAVCVLLATTKLDTNKTIRKKLSTHKVSFASIEESEKLTNNANWRCYSHRITKKPTALGRLKSDTKKNYCSWGW